MYRGVLRNAMVGDKVGRDNGLSLSLALALVVHWIFIGVLERLSKQETRSRPERCDVHPPDPRSYATEANKFQFYKSTEDKREETSNTN